MAFLFITHIDYFANFTYASVRRALFQHHPRHVFVFRLCKGKN